MTIYDVLITEDALADIDRIFVVQINSFIESCSFVNLFQKSNASHDWCDAFFLILLEQPDISSFSSSFYMIY